MTKILFVEHERNIENTGGGVIVERNKNFLKRYFNNLTIYEIPPYKLGRIRKIASIFNYILGCTPSVIYKIKKLVVKNKIDLVFFDNSLVGKIHIFPTKCKTITFFHNVEYLFYSQLKTYNWYDVHLIKQVEKQLARKSDILITLNERDSKYLKKLYGRGADLIWPTTFNDRFDINCKPSSSEHFLLFVGADFFGNTDGLFWFIENCMDKIHLKLKIVGKGMDCYKQKYMNQNVEFIGFVDNIDEYYVNSDAVVLPIISGSGMKTKTCEALMFGKKIFGTKEAFEGYDNITDYGCVECNTASEFILCINNFIADENSQLNKYNPLVRKYFLENFEENVVNEKLFRELNRLLK